MEKNQFIFNALRRASCRWPARNQAKTAARVRRGIYLCAACGEEHRAKDVQMDHVDPVMPLEGWSGWDVYLDRLFCGPEGWQVLCRGCHREKTKNENNMRK